jgi:fructose-1,6-bisphosphatase I
MTLEQFIIDQQERFPHSTGAFSRLLRDISVAAKIINRDIRRAGIIDIFGETGEVNVQGETQKRLDRIANEELVRALKRGGECCLIGSEEEAEVIPLSPYEEPEDKYAVLFDPLDGSSNIDVNVSVGTIFSIYQLPEGFEEMGVRAALQPGADQVAAGYVIYGSSTMLVYTTGDGVNGFTLDPSIGEFILSHPKLQIPSTGGIYSVNEGDAARFHDETRQYLRWLQSDDGKEPSKTRYIGSFVSDFHRNLLKGGIYLYPATRDYADGKLRLMYEANPMAFIAEEAGGRAVDGRGRRILDLEPEDLHQRTPLYIGSREMVDVAEAFEQGRRTFNGQG